MPSLPPLAPISDQPLSVLLLAGNASAHVDTVVPAWANYLDGLNREYELILVDDGSGETVDRARALAERHPRLRLVTLEGPRGEGAALRAGLAEARHPLLLYTPCDPAYRPADLQRLLDKRTQGLDKEEPEIDHVHVMPAYRAGRKVPLGLRALGWVWRLLCRVGFAYAPAPLPGWLGWRGHLGWLVVRVVFGLRSRDVLCPFRLVRRSIFTRIPIQSDGPFAHVEILAKANFLGHVLAEELPVDVPASRAVGARSLWREGYKVFNNPDFGPVRLEEAPSELQPSAAPEPISAPESGPPTETA